MFMILTNRAICLLSAEVHCPYYLMLGWRQRRIVLLPFPPPIFLVLFVSRVLSDRLIPNNILCFELRIGSSHRWMIPLDKNTGMRVSFINHFWATNSLALCPYVVDCGASFTVDHVWELVSSTFPCRTPRSWSWIPSFTILSDCQMRFRLGYLVRLAVSTLAVRSVQEADSYVNDLCFWIWKNRRTVLFCSKF